MVTVDRLCIGIPFKNLQVKVLQITNFPSMESNGNQINNVKKRKDLKKTVYSAIVGDLTGQIELVYRQNNSDLVKSGRILEISGKATSFNGRIQVQVGINWGEIKRIRDETLSSVKLLNPTSSTTHTIQPNAPFNLFELPINLSSIRREYGVVILRLNKNKDAIQVGFIEEHCEGDDEEHSSHEHHLVIPADIAQLNDTEKDAAVRALINATDLEENDFSVLSHLTPFAIYDERGTSTIMKMTTFYLAIHNRTAVHYESNLDEDGHENDHGLMWTSYNDLPKFIKNDLLLKNVLFVIENFFMACKKQEDVGKNYSAGALKAKTDNPSCQSNLSSEELKTDDLQANFEVLEISEEEYEENTKEDYLLPVTVLSGFLGAGKTTLLNYILHQNHGYKIAVIVNDMAEVNIDAQLVKNDNFLKVEESMVEMSNGCICCTLREDLLINIKELAKLKKFDYLVIESTGISEPLPVAETFTFEDETGESLSDYARLDTLVTVVDGINFLKDFKSADSLKRRNMEADLTDSRTVVDLLRDQIEFSNVILVNKMDLIPDEKERLELKELIQTLNPNAQVYQTTFSQIKLSKILNTNLFKLSEAQEHANWLKEARFNSYVPETIEYGVSSFVYKVAKPFHPERLWKLVHESDILNKVIRSKGFIWLASDNKRFLVWSQAGVTWRVSIGGRWWVDLRQQDHPKDLDKSQWSKEFGDRKQELIFIGIDMNQREIVDALNKCLLTIKEIEYGSKQWNWLFKDPFQALLKSQQEK